MTSIGSGKFGDIFKDDEYLTWIRAHACLVPGCRDVSTADHLIARGWREAKRDDWTAVPLCIKHHRERQAHTLQWFNDRYGVDLWREAHGLTKEFLLTRIEELTV